MIPVPTHAACRVAIIEGQAAIREMIQGSVEALKGYEVVGYAGDIAPACELCRRTRPDLVVLDLVLPSGSGFELLPVLRSGSPQSRVVIFSGHLRPGVIRRALVSGAHGVVEKSAPLREFHRALRAAAADQVYFSPFASEQVRQLIRCGGHRVVRLTERERTVLRCIAEGLSSKEISGRMELSLHTIGNVRARLSRKTGLRGVARLSRYAVQIGVVPEAVEGAAEAV